MKMKIITESKAYVQLNDLSVLMKFMEGKSIPSSIVKEIFSDVFICSDGNRYDFKEFSKREQVEFFKELDYSVDYNELKDKSEYEIMVYGDSIAKEMNKLAKQINSLVARGEDVPEELFITYDKLQFKMLSVRDILLFKQGTLKMNLPKIGENKKGIFKIFKRR